MGKGTVPSHGKVGMRKYVYLQDGMEVSKDEVLSQVTHELGAAPCGHCGDSQEWRLRDGATRLLRCRSCQKFNEVEKQVLYKVIATKWAKWGQDECPWKKEKPVGSVIPPQASE